MLLTNPFVELFRAPVETLTAAAYAFVLLSALVLTWYALVRNTLAFQAEYSSRSDVRWLLPLRLTARAAAACLIIAVDLLLIAGIIYVLT
jgi:hypothetical protein